MNNVAHSNKKIVAILTRGVVIVLRYIDVSFTAAVPFVFKRRKTAVSFFNCCIILKFIQQLQHHQPYFSKALLAINDKYQCYSKKQILYKYGNPWMLVLPNFIFHWVDLNNLNLPKSRLICYLWPLPNLRSVFIQDLIKRKVELWHVFLSNPEITKFMWQSGGHDTTWYVPLH